MILHITNDFSGSTVYMNLVGQLDALGAMQIVYTPLRGLSAVGKNSIEFQNEHSHVIYSRIIDPLDRVFYKRKIDKITADVEGKVDMSRVKIIHAHTWYSDGGVAQKLSKKYGIPYIVAVRNTDLNLFLKYRFFDRRFGREILNGAKKIVLISKVYQKRMLRDSRLLKVRQKLSKDSVVIPNGVDPYWISNKIDKQKATLNIREVNLLFIGKFTKSKNVLNLIDAVAILNRTSSNFRYILRVVGGGGNDSKRVTEKIQKFSFVEFLGPIYDKEKLRNIFYETHIFTMPSRAETFGLVYIESLLLGVPIIYTAGEGIDGFYDDSIGEKVRNSKADEIADKIKIISNNYENYNYDLTQVTNNHNWQNIARQYMELYKS